MSLPKCRKTHLLEDNQISSVEFLALVRHLEEIHVTWAHLEKKRTRLLLYTIYLEELCIQSVETASQASSDGVRIFMVTASLIRRRFQDVDDLKTALEDSTWRRRHNYNTTLLSFLCAPVRELSLTLPFFTMENANLPPTNNPPVLPTALRAKIVQELNELQAISTYIDSHLENIDQLLNDSDDDSDDGEVLNELEEYDNINY
ncbi:hypothetical protein Tco_1170003 [Tanacetum coccineum]